MFSAFMCFVLKILKRNARTLREAGKDAEGESLTPESGLFASSQFNFVSLR
jgi:hypothetical protein